MKIIFFIISLACITLGCFAQTIEFSKIKGDSDRAKELFIWHQSQSFENYGEPQAGGVSVTLLSGAERLGVYHLKAGATLHDLLLACGKLERMASSRKIKISNLYSDDLIELSLQSFSSENSALLPAMRFLLREGDLVYIPVRIE